MTYQYQPVALVAAHQALATLLDGGASAARIRVFDADETHLATFMLQKPCGTVDPASGQLALLPAGPELNAPAAGVAHHAQLEAGDGEAVAVVSVQEGTAPVPGALVLSVLNIVAGGTVELVSATIG